ncbi:unnamed protein product [Plutella xylostella]|uniref:(diamondback moth) hypothetical protein n=1 Tax=Plutella xylostella TaxID=51655 RepID=A0A8S4DGT8_PLUXY|nr:unnamed protein product [Plutella xylostella]
MGLKPKDRCDDEQSEEERVRCTCENDIEGAESLARNRSEDTDILSRLLCAVHGRGEEARGEAGGARGEVALNTHKHTDMLLLNLMRMNGLTPKQPSKVKAEERTFCVSSRACCSSDGDGDARGSREGPATGKLAGAPWTSNINPLLKIASPISSSQLEFGECGPRTSVTNRDLKEQTNE